MCDVGMLADPDLGTIDGLARFRLAVRRFGADVELRHASDDLRQLLAFTGLAEVLGVEPLGQAEEWEQRPGVEEEGELDDPAP